MQTIFFEYCVPELFAYCVIYKYIESSHLTICYYSHVHISELYSFRTCIVAHTYGCHYSSVLDICIDLPVWCGIV